MRYKAVVMGVSAGGLEALRIILADLPQEFGLPIAIVQHRGASADSFLAEYLDKICALTVLEAEDKMPMEAGHVYLAPAGYHLLIEPDASFSLSLDERVNYSCPAIDVLFESAADVFEGALIGVVLTGANADGALGLKKIKAQGGFSIVQNPATALASAMPAAAIAATQADFVGELAQIGTKLAQLSKEEVSHGTGS